MSKNIASKLNPYLSDLVVSYLKLHDLHWNVKGKMFVQVHLYTESRYNDMAEKLDEVAEKIIMNGEAPVTGMKNYLDLASISELNKGEYRDDEVLNIVLEDMLYLKNKAAELRKEFDESGEFGIVAMLEEHIAGYEKEIWFIQSMLK